MKRRQFTALLLAAALMALLTGCSQTPQQLEALSTAVQAYDSFYFEIQDASAQLKAQKLSGDTANATLTILVPDVSQMSADSVACALPDISLNADADALEAAYLTSFLEAGKLVMNSGSVPVTSPRTVGAIFVKIGDTWSCQLQDADMKTVQAGLEGEITALGRSVFEASGIREELALADTALAQLKGLLGSGYPVELTSMEKTGDDRYTFGFRYADPVSLYQVLADQAVDAWDEAFYDDREITVDLDLGSLPETESLPMLDGTITLVTDAAGNATLEDTSLATAAESAKAAAEADAALRITSTYKVTEQMRPSTKILSGTSSGNKVIIKTSAARGDYFLRFYLLPGTSLSDEGTEYMTCFVRGGDDFTIYLPSNNYKLEYAVGDTWYGSKYIFGPEGSYYLFKSLIDSEKGYYITLTLYGISGGNTPSETLPYNP